MLHYVLYVKRIYILMYVWGSRTLFTVGQNIADIVTICSYLFIFLKCVEGSVLLFHSHNVTTISKH